MFKLTLPPLSWPGYDDDSRDEDGFTLIEILVVIIIIGILAAVAIPIFLNQQRVARDSATTQDTRNAATALETGMVYDPLATEYKAFEDNAGAPGAEIPAGADGSVTVPADTEEFHLQVGSGGTAPVVKSEGTVLRIQADDVDGDGTVEGGAFRIDGWNEKGKEHKNDSTLVYRNALGGLQDESGTGSGSTTPGGENEAPGDGSENPGGGGESESPGVEISEGPAGERWWADNPNGFITTLSEPLPEFIAAGETITVKTVTYLPAELTTTGEAHFAPTSTQASGMWGPNWEMADGKSAPVRAGGSATFDLRAPDMDYFGPVESISLHTYGWYTGPDYEVIVTKWETPWSYAPASDGSGWVLQ